MNRQDIDKLVEQYSRGDGFIAHFDVDHQYDDRSADINYALTRHFKPSVVVEFGTRNGRCTHDILKALRKNGKPFIFKPYELEDDRRATAQRVLEEKISGFDIQIGIDIMKADDVPDGIDYLFVDNYHDKITTEWVFSDLIKKCKPGALVHFHDLKIRDDFVIDAGNFDEVFVMEAMAKAGTLPLEKLYWTWEEGQRWESAWFTYKPL